MFCQFSFYNIYNRVHDSIHNSIHDNICNRLCLRAWRCCVASLVLLLSAGYAQSVWLESGLAYRENGAGSYEPLFKVGLRGFLPLSEPLSLYGALAWRDGIMADVGVWYAFDPNLQDPFGFRTYGGAGLTFVSGDSATANEDSVGLALSVAASYAIDETFGLAVIYTHRPLLLPELSQAFDISIGLTLSLDSLLGVSDESINQNENTIDANDVQPLTAEPAESSPDTEIIDDNPAPESEVPVPKELSSEELSPEEPSYEDELDDSDSTPDAGQP
jgi:hypothetical protein